MEELEYAETVIKEVHSRTFHTSMEWRKERNCISATPTDLIYVSIYFTEEGPASARWDYAAVGHPVGRGVTLIGGSDSERSRHYPLQAAGPTLDRINEIFSHVFLEPRKKQFEAALRTLLGK